jgi:hypothetical protein
VTKRKNRQIPTYKEAKRKKLKGQNMEEKGQDEEKEWQ